MKKSILLGISLVAGLWSCTEDYADWASPQSNAANEAAQKIEMAVQPLVKSIDFSTYTESTVQLFTSNLTEDQVDNYSLLFEGEGVDKAVILDTDASGYLATEDLEEVVKDFYGANPVERTFSVTVFADVKNATADGDVMVRRQAAPFTLKAKLDAPFIDSGYYLTGDFAGWNKDGALAFTHVGIGNVYDAPEFQITFTTTADNQYWKIISATNYENDFWAEGETGVVGTSVDGDTSMEGTLTTSSPQAGKIEEAGLYRLTINMMEYTYKLEKLAFAQFVYFIGATDGWANADQKLSITDEANGIYTGFVYCADPNGWGNEFKFQKRAGDWADDSQLNSNNLSAITGDFEKGSDNIKASAGEGVYYVTLDLSANTLHAVKVNKMGIIGDFNGWGGDVEMTWNANDYCFEVTGAGVTANGWKFRINADWAINLGSNDGVEPSTVLNDLVANGKNIGVAGNTVKLYPTRKTSDKIYCTVE